MIPRWRQLALGLAVFGAMNLGDAAAEILNADLRVNGMSCPFCAFGIEKKLLDVDGVTKVEVLLDEGRLHLQLQSGNTATTAAFEAAVEKAGFELAGLAIEVRGTLDVEPTETWLEAHGGLRFLLLEREGDRERPLSPAARARLHAAEKGPGVSSGRVVRTADALGLVVDPPRTAAMGRP